MGVTARPWYTNEQVLDLLNGLEYHSKNFLETNNFVIQKNVISSVPWFAFVAPGHSCTNS